MPQLDISSYSSQLFWLVVSFFTMLSVMAWFIVPRIRETMDLRQRKLDGHIAQAKAFREKAEKALADYRTALDKAADKAAKALEKTKAELDKAVEAREAQIAKSLAAQIARGEREIARSRDLALKEANASVKELSATVLAKIGLPELGKGKH